MKFEDNDIKTVKQAAAMRYAQYGFSPEDAETLYNNFITNIAKNEKKASQHTLGDEVAKRLIKRAQQREDPKKEKRNKLRNLILAGLGLTGAAYAGHKYGPKVSDYLNNMYSKGKELYKETGRSNSVIAPISNKETGRSNPVIVPIPNKETGRSNPVVVPIPTAPSTNADELIRFPAQ